MIQKIDWYYGHKKVNKYNIKINNVIFDTMISAYLLNYEVKDDIKNGRVCTLEELKAEMEAKYESYRNSKG